MSAIIKKTSLNIFDQKNFQTIQLLSICLNTNSLLWLFQRYIYDINLFIFYLS